VKLQLVSWLLQTIENGIKPKKCKNKIELIAGNTKRGLISSCLFLIVCPIHFHFNLMSHQKLDIIHLNKENGNLHGGI
jgi:hypothetical protein